MIAVINPNASVSMTEQLERECSVLTGLQRGLAFYRCAEAPVSIEGYSDGAAAAYWVAHRVRDLEAAPIPPAAYVIACFDDTGLDAARELTRAPVLGIGETAMHAATLVCQNFCVMTSLERSVPILTRNLHHYGLASRCAGIFASGIPVLALERDPDSYRLVLDACNRALDRSGGEALVFGCAGMSHWVRRMESDLGMPVLDGVRIAVTFADAMVALGLTTSKVLSYRFPEVKAAGPAPGGVPSDDPG